MANLTFGSYDVLPRYTIEGTTAGGYGTSSAGAFGVIPQNPLFRWIDSAVQSLDPVQTKNSLEVYTLDQRRDPKFLLYMEKRYDYPLAYYPSDITFLSLGLTSVNTSFTIEEFWNPQAGSTANQRYYRFVGCMVDTVDISWRIGRPIEIRTGIAFQKEGPASFPDPNALSGFGVVTYGAEPFEQPFLFSDTSIKMDPIGSGAQTGSFANINILEATLRVENKRDRSSAYTIGADTITQLPLGRRHVEFSITRMFEDQNQVDQFEASLQGTNFQIKFPLGSSHSITVVNAKWDPLRMPKDVDRDLLVYTYSGKGFQPASGGNQITLV